MAVEHPPTPGPGAPRGPGARFRRGLVVANPIAGRGRGSAAAEALSAALRQRGFEHELRLTTGAGDARGWASAAPGEGFDLVLSVGGDGTLREIFDGLAQAGADLPVAALPMGTANVLALDFGLPRDPEGVAELVLNSSERALDLGQVTPLDASGQPAGEPLTSFLGIGVGLDGEVVTRLGAARKGSISKLSYLPHVGKALVAHRPGVLELELDGQRLTGSFGALLLANMIHYGGVIRLDRAMRHDDGRWELYLWRRGNLRELASTFLRGLVGRLPGGPCQRLHATRLVVSSDRPVAYHVDGDPGGVTPLAFSLTGRRQRLLVPPGTAPEAVAPDTTGPATT